MAAVWEELKRRNVVRVAITYSVVGWLILQFTDVLIPLLGLPEWVGKLVFLLLAIGFPLALVFAWAYELTPEGIKPEKDVDRSQSNTHGTGRKLDFIIMAVMMLALGYFAIDKFVLDPSRDSAATSNIVAGLTEVRELVDEYQYAEAFVRASKLDSAITEQSLREELWAIVSRTVNLTSDPPGASVWMRLYVSEEEDWVYLGQTPLTDTRVPLVLARFRLELEGYQTLYVAGWGREIFRLNPVDSLPEGMVRVPGGEIEGLPPGFEHLKVELTDYLIDTTEVTNRQYQRFVDADGYSNPEFWQHRMVKDGKELPFDEAMQLFQDQTGRPGPSTWEVGTYRDGMADQPVGGISWYEATAFARFTRKQLPTFYHWYWAASPVFHQYMIRYSNFTGKGSVPVRTLDGISRFGAFDMAGNVREWSVNQIDDSRFLLGGGWSDPEYMFTEAYAESPFDRNKVNGLRLMLSLDNTNLELAQGPIARPNRNYSVEHPVTDDIFGVYRRLYAYDAAPLNVEVVAREVAEHWTREEIELDAAYGNERLTVFLYLPRNTLPPYGPVAYFPGSSAIGRGESPAAARRFAGSFLVKSGRAVLYPVYKGTYNRRTDLKTDIQNETNSYREHVIQWSKDLGRALDYLETRPDIEIGRLGYFGFSWESSIAPVLIAVEPRIKASVLLSGGLLLQPTQREVDPFNFLPRVKIPTRMINTPNDFFFPLKTSQRPFYKFLGAEQKDSVLLEGAHLPPINDVARETLEWFDRHLGPAL